MFLTAFGELASLDHRRLYIDLPTLPITKPHYPNLSQSFQRTLKSSCPKSVKMYKKHLKKEVTKHEIPNRIGKLKIIVKTRQLTKIKEKKLNKIDTSVTKIMINAERKTSHFIHNS